MIRTVLADDQAVVRAGLRLILDAQDDIEVVGEACNGAEAVELVTRVEPDVALLDIRMPVMDGIEATRTIAASPSSCRLLILTTYGAERYVYDALRAGASGFLLKTDSPERLVDGIRSVAAGDSMLAPEITRHLIEQFVTGAPPTGPAPELDQLTEREVDVLRLLATGRSNGEIAAAMFVSEGTVKTHVARVLAKLQVRDRTQAVVFAYERGIIRPGQPG